MSPSNKNNYIFCAFQFFSSTMQKSQSAMEYLMTYGWAILIIAIVLVALFELGIFNSTAFAPRVQPGSCQVSRVTPVSEPSLTGTCNNEIPEYVAQFSGDGSNPSYSSNTYIVAQVPSIASSNTVYTVTMWIYVPSTSPSNMPFFGLGSYQAFEFFRGGVGSASAQLGLHRCTTGDTWESSIPVMSMNVWHFAAVAVSAPNYYFQLDGVGATVVNSNIGGNNADVVIGTQTAQCDGAVFTGDIADVQLYNTSLSTNDIQALYYEGIGGAPINTQNLVGWWPLNGNANDYSGNKHNGVENNIQYTTGWTANYNAP